MSQEAAATARHVAEAGGRKRGGWFGPGIVLAAAGIGAGDAVVASVTGIHHGTGLLWAIVVTVILKYALTEAVARWQLATGETIVRAWMRRFPRVVRGYFCLYLLLWTFLVGASLSSACGLAAATLFPAIPVRWWGVIHAVVGAVLVAAEWHGRFHAVIKVLVAIMALSMFGCAVLTRPDAGQVLTGLLVPLIPAEGGAAAVLALLGGIGGSLTIVCYGYWLREVGWEGMARMGNVRGDVLLAYLFTGAFGIALTIVAAGVSAPEAAGPGLVVEIGRRLEAVAGPLAHGIFLLGFWCTVFSALLGVWQGVPHVYVEVVGTIRPGRWSRRQLYLAALAWISLPPLVILWFRQPVAAVVTLAVAGAFFMPFLAGSLLYATNRRDWMGGRVSGRLSNGLLVACLVVFGAVCLREVSGLFD